jgi:hypothetical protein
MKVQIKFNTNLFEYIAIWEIIIYNKDKKRRCNTWKRQ